MEVRWPLQLSVIGFVQIDHRCKLTPQKMDIFFPGSSTAPENPNQPYPCPPLSQISLLLYAINAGRSSLTLLQSKHLHCRNFKERLCDPSSSMRDRFLLTEPLATTINSDFNNQLKPAPSPLRTTTNDTKNGTSSANVNPYADMSPAFNSSMAVTILVLLTALFFMGFFSVYVRRFGEENSAESVRRRRRAAATRARRSSSSAGGLDPNVIRSLPTFPYKTAEAVDESDCAVCLCEFDQGETVKLLPACSHLFHADCIDAWLASHTSCPLCRAVLFPQLPPPQGRSAEENREASDAATAGSPDEGDLVVRVEGVPTDGEEVTGLRRSESGCSLPPRIETTEEIPARRSCSF